VVAGLTSTHKGVAVIISNGYTREDVLFSNGYRSLQPLSSSIEDADKLKEAFEYLNFFTIVKYNVTEAELLSLLASFTDYHSYIQTYHRFIFAFFGYGEYSILYCKDEKSICVSEIISASIFSNFPQLFFFDVSYSAGSIP